MNDPNRPGRTTFIVSWENKTATDLAATQDADLTSGSFETHCDTLSEADALIEKLETAQHPPEYIELVKRVDTPVWSSDDD